MFTRNLQENSNFQRYPHIDETTKRDNGPKTSRGFLIELFEKRAQPGHNQGFTWLCVFGGKVVKIQGTGGAKFRKDASKTHAEI